MKKMYSIMMMSFLCIFIQSCAQKQTFEEYKNSFETDFKNELQENKVNNAAFAVFTKDSMILQGAFSAVNKKVDGDSPFLIGSITKVFTAVAIMQLYEQGKIDIDKPVSDYVTDFTINQRFPESEPITIRAVLTHHAGIPSDNYLHKFSKKSHDFNELLPYLNSQYTCYPVGKIYAYSNLGYALLGILVERVSGMKYEEYIKEQVFKPLGMRNSGFYFNYELQKALGIAYNTKGEKKMDYPLIDKPAGAIYSTINDMVKFCRSFIDGKELLLKNETLKKMFVLQNHDNLLDLDHRSAICFNFKNKAYELGRVLEHGGATMFHRAQMIIGPDAGLAAILLSDSPNGTDNAWKLDEQLMVEYCKAKGLTPDKRNNQEKMMQFTPVSTKKLELYAGNYTMPGMVCKFEWKNKHLSPTINGQNFYLAPHDSNSFVPARRFLGMMFKSKKMFFLLEEINGEKHFIQVMPWGGLSIIGTQTNPKPIPHSWQSRTGNYTIVNADKEDVPSLQDVKIVIENGFMLLKYGFSPEMSIGQNASLALNIINGHASFVHGYGRGGGESVVFDAQGKSFQYMGLKFEKQ